MEIVEVMPGCWQASIPAQGIYVIGSSFADAMKAAMEEASSIA